MKRYVHSSESSWEMLETKSVPDSDGFYTDYTLYFNPVTGEYATMFGDRDIYRPGEGYFDETFETEEEAYEWFDDYNGFEDDEDYF